MKFPQIASKEGISHFIAYVRWDIVLDWKKEEIKAGRIKKNSQVKPYAYGTAVKEVYERIQKNDKLWILTIPKFGEYSSYPSLNAMIIVKEKIDQKSEKDKKQLGKIPKYIKNQWDPIKEKGWQYVIIGNKDKSRYFPINNSYTEVVKPILKKGEDYYFEDIELATILEEEARQRLIKRIIERVRC
jgi:hypothetical protein